MASEQTHLDTLFRYLDDEVQRARARLDAVMLDVDPANPDPEALVQRETEYHALNARLDRLNIAHLGLVFGRIDVRDETEQGPEHPVPDHPDHDRRYIGRLGLHDRERDYETLLLDWRAPMARPYYLATTAQPEGVRARRHIRTKGTVVQGVTDEYLAGDDHPLATTDQGVGDESPLLAAVEAARSGHMVSIVQTIQAEQDAIIRHQSRGALVVTGGPGTGKTAVALHRVAYLLYTWREQLAKTGVLIIGPNATFLHYIARVLPELGETGVVLSTVGQLYPGVEATCQDPRLTREIKGSAEMVTILTEHIRSYQRIPEDTISFLADSLQVSLTPAMIKAARTRARRSRKPHNAARAIFADQLIEAAARDVAHRLSADPLGGPDLLGEGDIAELFDEIAEHPTTQQHIDALWPILDPVQVVDDLLTSTTAIAHAARAYDQETRSALYRADRQVVSTSDTALIDEVAHRIGAPDPYQLQQAQQQAWRQQIADAEDALDILQSSQNTDLDDESEAEILSAHDIIDAETLAMRQQTQDHRTTAERAQADYTWAYGHVVVDEAQEITPMEWRMILRRCPSRWMTIVGDTAQTSHPAGIDDWAETLGPAMGNRLTVLGLTVNYRTPQSIVDFAAPLAAELTDEPPATAIREGRYPVTRIGDAHQIPSWITTRLQDDPHRQVAVIVPDKDFASITETLTGAQSTLSPAARARTVVCQVDAVKGLEYDHVVVVDPTAIAQQSSQGWNDLYVAYTRATQSLAVVGDIPHPAGPVQRYHPHPAD
ncbi:HelD family protein [Corynebacterium choanae]|uniref:HelD family protein n=1 Tax=Corynebacterium choanae TaxID=1862358 RepID=UPI003CCC8B4C